MEAIFEALLYFIFELVFELVGEVVGEIVGGVFEYVFSFEFLDFVNRQLPTAFSFSNEIIILDLLDQNKENLR